MKQQNLSRWLKVIIVGMGIFGLILYALIVPMSGRTIAERYPEFEGAYLPWLIFIWISAIPCYAVLFIAWRVAGDIGNDKSFTIDNAKRLKYVSVLAAADSAFFFVGNVLLLCLNLSHPSVCMASMLVVFLGVAFSVVCAALSHLVLKASEIQNENDLTV